MKVVYGLVLIVLLAAFVLFAVQNRGDVAIQFLDQKVSTTVAVLVAGVYGLGMITGWTVVGFFRRSIHRISQPAPKSN